MDDVIISETKEHDFKNKLATIVLAIERVVLSQIEDKRLQRIEDLQYRKEDRLKDLSTKRHRHLVNIKYKEKCEFDSLLNNATKHNNCNIVRQYIKAMECQWSRESNKLTKEQKNKLKKARILINRYDPLVAEYKNLQDLFIDNAMINKPWDEIQKIIDEWLKI